MTIIQQKAINAIRMLSVEAVEKANSGHPGLPMGAAAFTYKLWADQLVHNPKNPQFENRDRFILSAGHGSMLLYSLLHLFGYGLTIDDLKNFRQMGSLTPGHPEYKHTIGVETTTGPLGQGYANAVGMAIAESYLAARFNRDGFNVVDHYTYALSGDGCMMEGITNEAASLAGTLHLDKLIVFYDDNGISIEGDTDIAFREDVGKRHEALGWNVIRVRDGNNLTAVGRAIVRAKSQHEKPSLIVCSTIIGFGSPTAGQESCHGAPLGRVNIEAAKQTLGWEYGPFEVPKAVYRHFARLACRGEAAERAWNALFAAYETAYPELAKEYRTWMDGRTPDLQAIPDLLSFDKPDATRNTSGIVLNKLANILPNLIGGSADLAPSNKTYMKNKGDFSAENRRGANMHFGVREHAMAAICNGMVIHGGLRVFCATFFVFSDYMKNAIRLSAFMDIPVTYVLTHDSIGVGEDGGTHQPIEQLTGLRAIPNLKVFRPADGLETAAAWIDALSGHGPTCIVLSRQNLPQYEHSTNDYTKGGYILADAVKTAPDVILIATGSEVEIAMKAKSLLAEKAIDARIVSMPCQELFARQSAEYQESVLPPAVRHRVSIEAGSTLGWYKYVGLDGLAIGIDSFGMSGPYAKLYQHFGLTADMVVAKVVALLAHRS
ncbi:MAG: transketolase [bacterium]